MYKLFLDDLRSPPDGTWVVARSHEAAVEYVNEYGYPLVISFDHDLGMKATYTSGAIVVYEEVEAATGMSLAKWLVERDLDSPWMASSGFRYIVHSANPVGAANIRGLFEHYSKVIGCQLAYDS